MNNLWVNLQGWKLPLKQWLGGTLQSFQNKNKITAGTNMEKNINASEISNDDY